VNDPGNWGYAKQAAAQITSVLQSLQYNYTFEEELGVFKLNFKLRQSGIKYITVFILVEKKLYTVSGLCPLRVPLNRMAAVGEYINRINRRIQLCQFVLDYDTGELRSRSSNAFRGMLPWPDLVEQSIRMPIELYERFGGGLLDVMYGNITAREAAEAALEQAVEA
jgi:hypothetical protein